MDNSVLTMTIALAVSAILIFGGGILLGKTLRSCNAKKDSTKKNNKKLLLTVSSLLIVAGLASGCDSGSTNDVQNQESQNVKETTSVTTTIAPTTASTESTTTTTATTTTATPTTTVATTTDEPLLPINDLEITEKEVFKYSFLIQSFSDNTVAISGVSPSVESETVDDKGYISLFTPEIMSYSLLYGNGSQETVVIPKNSCGKRVRAFSLGSDFFGYKSYEPYYWDNCWRFCSTVIIPEGMELVYEEQSGYVEVPFDEAASVFAEHGITLKINTEDEFPQNEYDTLIIPEQINGIDISGISFSSIYEESDSYYWNSWKESGISTVIIPDSFGLSYAEFNESGAVETELELNELAAVFAEYGITLKRASD